MPAPRLKKKKIEWHGYHSFRRGLGTNLYHLRVPDKIIRAILRHADLGTTMKHYVKVARCESGDGQAESGVEWDVEKEKETVKM